MNPGFRDSYRGRQNVILTHPLNKGTPCTLTTETNIPKGKKTRLKVLVSHHNGGDWDLVIRINGATQKQVVIGKDTVNKDGWLEVSFDLTPFAGNNNVRIDLENKPTGWSWEAGYWAGIEII
jgi:hypothetical protein